MQAARHEALTWTGSPLNAERVGTYLRSYGATAAGSRRPRGQTLGDYTALLTEWSVPGVVPPPDLDATTGAMWSRSVTLAVLQYLRRHGHLG